MGRKEVREMLDPVKVAHGQHAWNDPVGNRIGVCCRCGVSSPGIVAVRAVVSAKFNGWDQLHHGDGLCPACAWSFRPEARALTLAISTHNAISGRKHTLPYAQWGTVRVDDVNLFWREADVERLRIAASLRARGLPGPALHEHAPPSSWLRNQPLETWLATQREWDALEPWRNTAYLPLVVKATAYLKGNR
jgi:hypothetical protein